MHTIKESHIDDFSSNQTRNGYRGGQSKSVARIMQGEGEQSVRFRKQTSEKLENNYI